MALYARPDCPSGHRIRLVLAEKGVADYHLVEVQDSNEDLAALNPHHTLPTLVDRELVLYESYVILEYVDERYPYPPLMPIAPGLRARYRMAMARFEAELYGPAADMDGAPAQVRKARSRMRESLIRLANGANLQGTLGQEYSLLDCTLAPILLRMDFYRLRLPARQSRALRQYARRLFRRDAFVASLAAAETAMLEAIAH